MNAGVSFWSLFATGLLVLLNGFFVAAEFALVKTRRTRIEALAAKGSGKARVVQRILDDLNLYLSACQLGITLASLALGWLAEPAVATLLLAAAESVGIAISDGPALHIIALILAMTVITILHMTIGEQAPKVYAIRKPEPMALACAYPLYGFAVVFRPFIWLINVISNALLRLVGITSGGDHDDGPQDVEELQAVLRAASRAGHITNRQHAFGENVLGLMRLEVRHIMLPRVDIVYLTTEQSSADQLEIIRVNNHTRFPICNGTLEDVVGIVHGKDVLTAMLGGDKDLDLLSMARPVAIVPDTQRISMLILELQQGQKQCAMVVDEHGTTVGMAFLEDALEEIVGPMHDEFDEREPWVAGSPDGSIELSGSVPVPEAEAVLGLELSNEIDTVGGFVTDELGHLPKAGETLTVGRYLVTVLAMSRRRVGRVRFEVAKQTADD